MAMRKEYPSFVVDVPATFEPRFASVFLPQRMPFAAAQPKYVCIFPAASLPPRVDRCLGVNTPGGWKPAVRPYRGTGEFICTATSRQQPQIIPGAATPQNLNDFACLKWLCKNTGMPLDWIFRERHIRLLVQPFEFSSSLSRGGYSGCTLELQAVQIIDLDEGFLRRELKKRIEQLEEDDDVD